LLYAGPPQSAEQQLAGKVWRKSIAKSELDDYRAQHRVISTKLVAGRPLIHIYNEQDPSDGFTPVEPDLEDVFFVHIHSAHHESHAPVQKLAV
jgi:hypothetical protein